jgi:hypothetical protein
MHNSVLGYVADAPSFVAEYPLRLDEVVRVDKLFSSSKRRSDKTSCIRGDRSKPYFCL